MIPLAYGHHELAADIADKTIDNAIKNGISENHDSLTGKALGVPDYSMSSTLVAMMIDGLSVETPQCALKAIGPPRCIIYALGGMAGDDPE